MPPSNFILRDVLIISVLVSLSPNLTTIVGGWVHPGRRGVVTISMSVIGIFSFIVRLCKSSLVSSFGVIMIPFIGRLLLLLYGSSLFTLDFHFNIAFFAACLDRVYFFIEIQICLLECFHFSVSWFRFASDTNDHLLNLVSFSTELLFWFGYSFQNSPEFCLHL